MAIPIHCAECDDFIGTEEKAVTRSRVHAGGNACKSSVVVDCPGKGKHPGPDIVEEERFFGLITRVTKFYPQTLTSSSVLKYSGPKNRLLLWLAMRASPNGRLLVNGEWVFDFNVLDVEFD